MKTYSEAEIVLIKHYGFTTIFERVEPWQMYKMMEHRAFVENDRSIFADALRRAMIAFDKCTHYRKTKEWDDLIRVNGHA